MSERTKTVVGGGGSRRNYYFRDFSQAEREKTCRFADVRARLAVREADKALDRLRDRTS